MPLDSVSITLTSSSVYHSADQISHLPTLSLLPILSFLHILFRSMYLWINLYSCPYKDRNVVACLIAQNKERKKIFFSYWKGERVVRLLFDTGQNTYYKKQHANVFIICNTFYFAPTYAEQWSTFQQALPCAFHADQEQRSSLPILLQASSNSEETTLFNVCTCRQKQQTLTNIGKSQHKHFLQLTGHTKF